LFLSPVQELTREIQGVPSNLQPPTSNLQPRTSNLRPPTSNLEPPTSTLAHHHLSSVKASGLSVWRCLKSAITSASPTAASAAATVITKNVMIWPSTVPR
jgi:hypothetical protein